MGSIHTPGPWCVAEEVFDNDGVPESAIRGLDGRACIAVTLDFGPNNPAMREANARRIVACVNAAKGIDTEHLEQQGFPWFADRISSLVAQRQALLDALRPIAERGEISADIIANARAAIAKATGAA